MNVSEARSERLESRDKRQEPRVKNFGGEKADFGKGFSKFTISRSDTADL